MWIDKQIRIKIDKQINDSKKIQIEIMSRNKEYKEYNDRQIE